MEDSNCFENKPIEESDEFEPKLNIDPLTACKLPRMNGRRPAPERSQFHLAEDGERSVCNHCHKTIGSKIERLRNHLLKCSVYDSAYYPDSLPVDASSVYIKAEKTSSSTDTSRRKRKLGVRAPEWNEISRDDGSLAVCKHCGQTVSPKIERIRTHLSKCTAFLSKPSAAIYSDDDDSGEDTDEYVPEKKSTKSRKSNREHSENDDIDEAIARFFYEANVPPIKAENMHFRAMIYKLRPNYTAPDRYTLEKRLLEYRNKR